MITLKKRNVILMATAMTLLFAISAKADLVFSENFDPLGDPNLPPAWTMVEAIPFEEESDPYTTTLNDPNDAPYLVLPKRTIKASLSQTITDFKVRWRWQASAFADVAFLYLTNTAGTQGYGIRWNSGNPGSQQAGHVNVIKWDQPEEINRGAAQPVESEAYLMGPSQYLSGVSTDAPFADFEFERDDTGLMRLAVTDGTHGVHEFAVSDPDFTDFTTVYLVTQAGTSYFDEIEVYPYEPINCEDVHNEGYGLIADVVIDCHIDLLDFAAIAADWARCNNPADAGCEVTW